MNTRNQLSEIKKILVQHSTPEAAAAHNKFVPQMDDQKVYGVRTPVLNELAKTYRPGGFELAGALWKAGALEEKILAGKLLGLVAKKDPEQALQLVETFSKTINDWAVCDTLGMQALKPIVKTHQQQIFKLAGKLNNSKDLWQRRLSLVLVEYYTRMPELHPQINKLIEPLENDPEYYVKKAVVWIRKNFKKGR